MAAFGTLSVPCPACAEAITIPATLTLTGRQVDGAAQAVASLDETAIREHTGQHQEPPA
jgi:hypothetical protein